MRIYRSIAEPIRGALTWDERWRGPDGGLILCWENGRRDRASAASPETILAVQAAQRGELPVLPWSGGRDRPVKKVGLLGTLQYLATWQGMRGEDLDIDTTAERCITCTRTKATVTFRSGVSGDESPLD